ncbi:MAG: LysR family transcriptional regulator [Candidatus Binatia bacterium]
MTLDRGSLAGRDLRARDIVGSLDTATWSPPGFDPGCLRRSAITLNQISLFAAVVKHVSITKASQEFRVSQPWVSTQLKQLEIHYATKLYRKVGRGIEITDMGRRFLRDIAPILDQVARIENQFVQPPIKATRETLSVGGTFSACAALLPSLLARFRLTRPEVDLIIRTGTSDELERLLLAADLELAVTLRAAPSAKLFSEPLRRERIALFVLSSHALAQRKNLQFADVLAEPLIIRGGSGSSGVTDDALTHLCSQGVEPKIGMRCDGPTAIKAAVREKMGVGVLFADSIKAEVKRGEFKILEVSSLVLEGHSYIVYLQNKPLAPLAQEFLELLHSVRGQNGEAAKIPATAKRWPGSAVSVA